MTARVWAILRKEFQDYRRNKPILITAVLLPLVFAVLSMIASLSVGANASPDSVESIVGSAMVLLLIIPVIIPTAIAAHTVIGEREQGTLEPLLSTPATDREILVGKALSAWLPAVAISWLFFAVYVVGVRLLATDAVFDEVGKAHWFVAQGLVTPALALLAVFVGMIASIRSSDVRVAQQISALALLPALVVLSVISTHAVTPSVSTFIYAFAVLFALSAVTWRIVVRLFDRERLISHVG
jgi:ABC-type Na+ efflux pump permease subunit